MTTLYFAYGSNLGESLLRTRCPCAYQVGIARIDGYRIGFTRRSINRGGGVADLVPAPDCAVWGAVFELREDGIDRLDEYEGVPHAYQREVWDFVASDGSPLSAWVYLVAAKQIEVPPSKRYWKIVVDGAREAGLPAPYIAELEQVNSLPEP